MLPTFVVIGAMKAGTTTLWSQLDRHPEIFVCRPKEPQFFSLHWDRGLGWYEDLFAPAGDALARGEASTTYTSLPAHAETVDRMADTIPDARLIYVVRDPVDRMRSHWLHRVHEGQETRPIERALRTDVRYANRSRYGMQIERYLTRFPPAHVHLVRAEQLYAAPDDVLPSVFAFIGVAPDVPVAAHQENASANRFDLPANVRRSLHRKASSRLYRAVPRPVRRLVARPVRAAMRTPVPSAAVSAELRAELMAALADDQALLRELMDVLPVS
jgi:hypothetical protein